LNESFEKRHYKKKYMLRKHEENEREKEIKEFVNEEDTEVHPQNPVEYKGE